MTDQLRQLSSFELPESCNLQDDDPLDELNDLTFGDEIPWDFDQAQMEDIGISSERSLHEHGREENRISSDLLGLTGSFFRQGLFKFGQKSGDSEISDTGDNEFELAIQKLDLLDKESNYTNAAGSVDGDQINLSSAEKDFDSKMADLIKYSEFLFQKFNSIPKNNTNIDILHQVVKSHLSSLNGMALQLKIPMDDLLKVKYYQVLKSFISIDSALANIHARFYNMPAQNRIEIATLIQNFSSQTPQQQRELAHIHPFYTHLLKLMTSHNQNLNASRAVIKSEKNYEEIPEWATEEDKRSLLEYQQRKQLFESSEGGWMSSSERDWLAKLQTRNLTFENPYVHDYYYTKWKLNEMTEARNREIKEKGFTNISDPLQMLPSPITADQLGAGIDPNKEGMLPHYKPIHFENSLGVLSASNLNTPRQIIQVPHKNEIRIRYNMSDERTQKLRSHTELLGLIERMYSIILRVDEVDKSLARVMVVQHKNSVMLLNHRNYLLKLLMDCVSDSTKFASLFSVEKGAKIFISIIAIVTTPQFVQLMRLFFFNCQTVYASEYYDEIESNLQIIIVSRVKVLKRDELSILITAFYCDLKSLQESSKLKPLSGFCKRRMGFHVVLSVLETFLQRNPEDRSHIEKLVSVALQSVESQSILESSLDSFNYLFSGGRAGNSHAAGVGSNENAK